MWEALVKTARNFALALPVVVACSDHVVSCYAVHGESMQPTLNPAESLRQKDYILFLRWNTRNRRYQKGDVVVLSAPDDPGSYLVKRIIGTEHEVVRATRGNRKYVRIPKGHCWVEGDNAHRSVDSRTFGPVALALIEGKVTHIVWPPHRIGRVSNQPPPSVVHT